MFDSDKFTIDVSRWPLVVITPRAQQLSESDLNAIFNHLDLALDMRSGRFALVIDSRAMTPPSAKQRALIGEYCLRSADRTRSRCVSIAVVASTDVMRASVTAVSWHSGAAKNVETFDDPVAAITSAQQRLGA
jgi:hypothetical protein